MASNYPAWVINGGPQERYMYGVYGYMPSHALAWTALGLFSAVGFAALVLTLWKSPKCWWMYLLPLTCLMEALGYFYRLENERLMTLATVITTIILLLIPPIIGAILLYEMMGYMLERAKTKLFCLKPKWVAWFFLTGDVLSFLVQCGAAGLLTSKDSAAQDTGSKIVLTGLVIQFLIFLFFAYSAYKLWRLPVFATTKDPVTGEVIELVLHTKKIFVTLLVAVFLLLVRNTYRLYEYGNALALKRAGKPKDAHEAEFYVLDTVPVLLVCVLLTVVHFGAVIKEAEAKRLEDEKKAAAAEGLQMVGVGAAAPVVIAGAPNGGAAVLATALSPNSATALAFAKSSNLTAQQQQQAQSQQAASTASPAEIIAKVGGPIAPVASSEETAEEPTAPGV